MSPNPNEPEKVLDKAIRKFTDEPFVPIGAFITTLFLGYGLKAFHTGQPVKAQQLMRGRVLAQGFTVLAMLAGAGLLGFKPHDRPATMEEKMSRLER